MISGKEKTINSRFFPLLLLPVAKFLKISFFFVLQGWINVLGLMKDDLLVVDLFVVGFFVRVFVCDWGGLIRFVSAIIDDFEFRRDSSLKKKMSNFLSFCLFYLEQLKYSANVQHICQILDEFDKQVLLTSEAWLENRLRLFDGFVLPPYRSAKKWRKE